MSSQGNETQARELKTGLWSAVNPAEGVLSVRRPLEEVAGEFHTKEPKTATGRRVVMLGSIACEALEQRPEKALSEHMEPSEIPLMFPSTTGTLHRPSNFARNVWHPIRKSAGISDGFKFHDLQHTQASLMIAAGVPVKVIQKRFGHSDHAVTANTYSHLSMGAQAERVDRLFENVPNHCTVSGGPVSLLS